MNDKEHRKEEPLPIAGHTGCSVEAGDELEKTEGETAQSEPKLSFPSMSFDGVENATEATGKGEPSALPETIATVAMRIDDDNNTSGARGEAVESGNVDSEGEGKGERKLISHPTEASFSEIRGKTNPAGDMSTTSLGQPVHEKSFPLRSIDDNDNNDGSGGDEFKAIHHTFHGLANDSCDDEGEARWMSSDSNSENDGANSNKDNEHNDGVRAKPIAGGSGDKGENDDFADEHCPPHADLGQTWARKDSSTDEKKQAASAKYDREVEGEEVNEKGEKRSNYLVPAPEPCDVDEEDSLGVEKASARRSGESSHVPVGKHEWGSKQQEVRSSFGDDRFGELKGGDPSLDQAARDAVELAELGYSGKVAETGEEATFVTGKGGSGRDERKNRLEDDGLVEKLPATEPSPPKDEDEVVLTRRLAGRVPLSSDGAHPELVAAPGPNVDPSRIASFASQRRTVRMDFLIPTEAHRLDVEGAAGGRHRDPLQQIPSPTPGAVSVPGPMLLDESSTNDHLEQADNDYATTSPFTAEVVAREETRGRAVLSPNEEVYDGVRLAEDEQTQAWRGHLSCHKDVCIMGLLLICVAVTIGVPVALSRNQGSVAVENDSIVVESMDVAVVFEKLCNMESHWRQLGRHLTHPNWWSRAKRPGYVTSINRAFGAYISLSAQGTVLAVTGKFSDGVSVFRLQPDKSFNSTNSTNPNIATIPHFDWVKLGGDIIQGPVLFGRERDFYEAVSATIVSGNGKRVAASFPHYTDGVFKRRGLVKVYEWKEKEGVEDGWKPVGEAFLGPKENVYLGDKNTFDLNHHGGIIAISNYRFDNKKGLVQVFRFEGEGNATRWRQMGEDLVGFATGDELGQSISLSALGTELAVGSSYTNTHEGSATVYRFTESEGWTQVGNALTGRDQNACGMGDPVKLSADGTRLAVWSSMPREVSSTRCIDWVESATSNGDDLGQVRVYELVNSNEDIYEWVQVSPRFVGDTGGLSFGWALSLSGNGKTVAIGVAGGKRNGVDSGYVVSYHENPDGNWTRVGKDINGTAQAYWAGDAVAISHNGEIMAVGSPLDFLLPSSWYDTRPNDTSGVVSVYHHCLLRGRKV